MAAAAASMGLGDSEEAMEGGVRLWDSEEATTTAPILLLVEKLRDKGRGSKVFLRAHAMLAS